MTLKADNRVSRAGFTLVEMLMAGAIMMLASVMAVYGWIYVMRGERKNSIQAELDMNVRMAIERIRSEVRLSAIDRIVSGVNLRELSVWIVSPVMKRNVRSPMCAVVGAIACSCISMREASGFQTAR